MRPLHLIALLGLLGTSTFGCTDTPSARAAEIATVSSAKKPVANLATHPSAPVKPETAPAVPAQALPPKAALSALAPAVEEAQPMAGRLSVVRFELAEAVEAREPVRVGQSFAAGTKVHAFLELKNKDGEPTALLVQFERDGAAKKAKGLRLEVPKMERYRTHAFTGNTDKPGHYRCTVSSEDGKVVAQKEFDIVAATTP